jgi:hypothetical protein
MRVMVLTLIALALGSMVLSCAQLEEMHRRDMEYQRESFRNKYCSYEGAYSLGVNDAKAGRDMGTDVSERCLDGAKGEAQRGYREGYTSERQNRPTIIQLQTQVEKPDCHYEFGDKVCGYNCLQSYGHWYCAKRPQHVCVEQYGKVKCGLNCRSKFGQITCDVED